MRNRYKGRLALGAGLVLAASASYGQVVPVAGYPGDVIVGDGGVASNPLASESATRDSNLNVFVYPDAFNLRYLVLPSTDTGLAVKWSYAEETGRYTVNGVPGLDLAGGESPADPPVGKTLDQDLDPAQRDSVAGTVTIRDQILSPDDSPRPEPIAGPGIVAGPVAMTLFAGTGDSFNQVNLMVYTANDSPDDVFYPEAKYSPARHIDWLDPETSPSAIGWGGFGGGQGGQPGTGEATYGPNGLALSVPAAGTNTVSWISPEGFIELVDHQVYDVRTGLGSDQLDPDAIPFFNVAYDNFFSENGVPTDGNNFLGQAFVLDVEGGALGIGRENGISSLDFMIAPASIDLPQWRGFVDPANSAFSTTADSFNDMRLIYRILDFQDQTNGDADSGTIYITSIQVNRVPLEALTLEAVWNPTIASATHFAETSLQAGLGEGTATIDDGSGTVNYAMITPPAGGGAAGDGVSRKTLGPFDSANFDGTNVFEVLYPVLWADNELLVGRMELTSPPVDALNPDPVDIVGMIFDGPTNELGLTHGVSRGAPGNMHRAGSPREALVGPSGPVPQWYYSFMFTQNATDSPLSNAGRLRLMGDFFNTSFIDPTGDGSDPFTVHRLEVHRTATPLDPQP